MMVLVCLPSDALSEHLPSYLGFSDLGHEYLFMAAPAKHSRCSLPWTRGISSQPPLLTLTVEYLLSALLHPCIHQSLDVGLLLSATTPGLRCGVAPGMWSQVGLRSITMNKASRVDGIPVELFQILKDDSVKVLHSICQQIWKTQQWATGLEKICFHSNPKERQCQRMLKHNCTHLTR